MVVPGGHDVCDVINVLDIQALIDGNDRLRMRGCIRQLDLRLNFVPEELVVEPQERLFVRVGDEITFFISDAMGDVSLLVGPIVYRSMDVASSHLVGELLSNELSSDLAVVFFHDLRGCLRVTGLTELVNVGQIVEVFLVR